MMELTILQIFGLLVTGGMGGNGLLILTIGWKSRTTIEGGEPGAGCATATGLVMLVLSLVLLIWTLTSSGTL